MSTAQLGRVGHARSLSLVLTALTSALLLVGLLPSVASATSFAARASISGGPQYVNDSVGTTFTFTVKNTGYATKIGALKITRPFSAWTVSTCSGAPSGWTVTQSAGGCTFSSPSGATGDIAPGGSATFMLTAKTVPEAADISGTWKVIVSKTNSFSNPSNLVQAAGMGAGLKTKAYSFQVLSAVISATPATPGAACPVGSSSAPAASTGNVIVICGRNRSTGTQKPNAAHSSLGGTFIASHGSFSSAPVAPSTTSRVLGNWANVTITSASGSGKTLIATIGRLSQQSPKTTLDGFNALNSPPTVTTSTGSTPYTENDPPTTIDGALTVSDPDDSSLIGAQVRISAGFVAASDTLGFTNQNGITGSYNSATGVLTLTGTATVADYQTALRSVTYANSSDTPTTSRTIAFSASDVHAFGAEATKSIAITAVNDAPTVATSGGSAGFTEGGPAVTVDPSVTVSDVDSPNLSGATASITTNFSSADGDTLGFTNQSGITGSYNGTTGVLSLSGSATVADYQAALRTIKFSNTSDNPSTATRTVSLQVNDGAASNNLSNVATRDVTVGAVNDPPVVTTSSGTPSYSEGGAAVAVDPC